MKTILPILLAGFLAVGVAPASESAPDCSSAVDTLRAGIALQPEQAVALFRDALQTNPGCRRRLFMAAAEIVGDDPDYLKRLLYAARLEFPGEESLFAEAALITVPDCGREIREAILAPASGLEAALSGAVATVAESEHPLGDGRAVLSRTDSADPKDPAEAKRLDDEIREAIARVGAKTEGRAWPEQRVEALPPRFRKPDEIRISRTSRFADEASLVNDLPLDRHDEREIAPGTVRFVDRPGAGAPLRLDESKFVRGDREAALSPSETKARPIAPAGAVGLPRPPRSSVYYIPPPTGSYESTIDQESGELSPPPLVIRPEPVSRSSPRAALR
jgi:hypothetical protein